MSWSTTLDRSQSSRGSFLTAHSRAVLHGLIATPLSANPGAQPFSVPPSSYPGSTLVSITYTAEAPVDVPRTEVVSEPRELRLKSTVSVLALLID